MVAKFSTEQEKALKTAEKALSKVESVEGLREIWRTHIGQLGHRNLGRLLLGQTATSLIEKRGAE